MYFTYNVDVLFICSEGAGAKAGAAIAAAAMVASVTVITKDLDQIPDKVGKGGD